MLEVQVKATEDAVGPASRHEIQLGSAKDRAARLKIERAAVREELAKAGEDNAAKAAELVKLAGGVTMSDSTRSSNDSDREERYQFDSTPEPSPPISPRVNIEDSDEEIEDPVPLRVTPSPGVRLKYAINSPRPDEVLPSRGKKVASKPKAEKKEKVKKFKDVPAPTAEEILVFYSSEEDVEEETRMKRKHRLQHILHKHSSVLAAEIRRRTKEAESANLASRIRGSSLSPLAPRNKPSEDSKGKDKVPEKRKAAEDAEKQFKKDLKKARKASAVGPGSSSKDAAAATAAAMASGEIPYPPQVVHIDPVLLAAFNEGTLPDSLMSHVEGLIVAKNRAEEWEQNRSLRVAKRLEEEDHAEKERVEKEKEKKEKELALKTQPELEKKKNKALLAEQMKQAAKSLMADKAKSEARKKAAEKTPEVQGGNEEVDREKTEYEKTRDAARETSREIGLKARHDSAVPSDTKESQDLPQTVLSKKITMTRQASQIAEVKKTAKEFGLKIKVPAGRSSSTSSSAAVPLKKAIHTLVPDTSTVKLTSLAEEQEQAASSPTVLSEHTTQQEEGDEVLGKNQEDITRPEEPPTSSSLPRTESVDASAEEGRTCDFEAEASDLHANDAETDADAPVPTPEVRVKKVVKKKFVAPSDPLDPSDPNSSNNRELLSPKPKMPISSDREKVYFKTLKNAELHLMRLENGLKYKEETSAKDRRFWSFELQDYYAQILLPRTHFAKMKYINDEWFAINRQSGVMTAANALNNMHLLKFVQTCQNWNDELILQFYATFGRKVCRFEDNSKGYNIY
ncbi:inner centromere protein-like [Brachypodium distachyon]|uniref:inner centromere protein-like n=1 Tax=Brachypodium distachyon TaxID=15368 RepID=UPI00071DDD2A|nr:inner centromere protein-like [Brachypodium distachyon]|eukprot:XP_010233270.2 inner centromere protein-like [Brachypodium distachyon]